MTPAVNILKKAGVAFKIHQYEHDPGCDSYGEEAADKLGLDPVRVHKTLVAQAGDDELVVAVLPVSAMLDLKALAKAVKVKKMKMADKSHVQKTTGYVVGGVSPLAQKKRLLTVIDNAARGFGSIFISGGKRGLDIEIAPDDLARLTGATFASIGK